MNTREYQDVMEVDLKDLCFALFIRWKWILAAMLFVGVLGGAYGYRHSVAPVPVSLEKNSDLEANIEKIYDQQNLLEIYEANENQSMIAKLDSSRVSSFGKSYIVTVEDNELSTLIRVLIYYSNLLKNAEQWEQIAASLPPEYRVPAESVGEILQVQYALLGTGQMSYSGSLAGQIDVTILGPDGSFCEDVMHILDQTIADNTDDVSKKICGHTITSDSERYYTFSSDEIREKQEEFISTRESAMNAIAAAKKGLSAEQLSYAEDMVAYMQQGMTIEEADQAYAENWKASHSPAVSLKYVLLGAILGAGCVCACAAVSYIMAGRLRTAFECENTWGMTVMGRFFQQEKEKKGLTGLLVRLRYGKEYLNDETEAATGLLQARVQLGAEKQKLRRIYVTGTDNKKLIDRVYQMLQSRKTGGTEYFCGQGGLHSAEELQNISGADAVLLVEQIGKTKHEDLKQMKKFLCEQQKKLLGVVVYR